MNSYLPRKNLGALVPATLLLCCLFGCYDACNGPLAWRGRPDGVEAYTTRGKVEHLRLGMTLFEVRELLGECCFNWDENQELPLHERARSCRYQDGLWEFDVTLGEHSGLRRVEIPGGVEIPLKPQPTASDP